MFEIMVGDDFAAAHNLRKYKGKCEALHGHNYKVWVKVLAQDTNDCGLAVDFNDIRHALKEIIGELDHVYLNDMDFFKKFNPTSELISKYIFDKLLASLKVSHPHLVLEEVQVWETDKACAIYRKK